MPLRSSFENRVVTPIPANVHPSAVIELLHNHSYLIHTQPLVTHFHPRPQSDGEGAAKGGITYDVWERVPLLPGNLLTHEIHFTSAFRDTKDGVVSHVNAPMGFVSDATYIVRPREMGDAKDGALGGEWTLEEQIHSECSVAFKWFIQSTMLPVRKKLHEGLIAKARQESRAQPNIEHEQATPPTIPQHSVEANQLPELP